MIGSIKHKGLKRLYESDEAKGVRADMADRIRVLLGHLEAARSLDELAALPSLKLHPLKGDLKGYWAITVRANWRLVFTFAAETASDLELIDYH